MAITAVQVAEKVRAIAAEQPNFIYHPPTGGACLYVQYEPVDGILVGGCIVGKALLSLGVSPEDIDEGMPASSVVGHVVDADAYGTIEALRWLDTVQENQDSQHTWGESVKNADEDHHNR